MASKRRANSDDVVADDVASYWLMDGEKTITVGGLVENVATKVERQARKEGFEMAIRMLKDLAAEKFVADKDQEADAIKRIANSLKYPL